jgi:hypothetical protein
VDEEDQKFMAVEGMHAWASAILTQVDRLELARGELPKGGRHRRAYLCERHFLLMAAKKLCDYIDWARDLNFLDESIFEETLRLRDDVLYLRDMNEHVIASYRGTGKHPEHWVSADELIIINPDSTVGTKIGGRLDWNELAKAAFGLLNALPRHYFPSR